MNAAVGNDIGWKRVANIRARRIRIRPGCQRIVNDLCPALRVDGAAEIACFPFGPWNRRQESVRVTRASAFVIDEEEGAVALDAAAERASKQVVLELALRHAVPI